MNRRGLFVAAFAVLSAAAMVASAKPPAKLPMVTGGGVAENFNVPEAPHMYTHFSMNAQATDAGEIAPFLGNPAAIDYPAKGQVEYRNVLADDNTVTTSQLHGEVVCMADLGESVLVDAGGNPLLGVFEVRFHITQLKLLNPTTGRLEDVPLDPATPIYGSLFVQDGGKMDFMDESFSNLTNPECLANTQFELEPVTQGNIVAH